LRNENRQENQTQHDVETQYTDETVLVDIDLSILGSESEIFDQYEAAIWYEYRYVPLFMYMAKSAEIPKSFLDRDRIYRNRVYEEKFEAQAKTNLMRTLSNISR